MGSGSRAWGALECLLHVFERQDINMRFAALLRVVEESSAYYPDNWWSDL